MHFTVYIPNARGADPGHLARVGLPNLAKEPGCAWNDARGPDGTMGVLGAWRPHGETPAPMSCNEIPNWESFYEGKFWIGWDAAHPPTPEELRKKMMIGGGQVRLADGNLWVVPYMELMPHRHVMDPNTGEIDRRISPEYREFWERGAEIMLDVFRRLDILDYLEGTKLAREVPPEVLERKAVIRLSDVDLFCSKLLALNYRVEKEIVLGVLNLLDDAICKDVVNALLQMEDLLQVRDEKKTEEFVVIPLG